MNFKEWMNQAPDIEEKEIDSLYDKAHIAVDLVRDYCKQTNQPDLLVNISTIANLATGAYGLYNSGENKDIIDPSVAQRLIYRSQGQITKDQLEKMPRRIMKQYFPDLDMRYVNPGDTIRINIRRILSQAQSDLQAVLEIASTIIHEATHDVEKREKEDRFGNGSPLTEIEPQRRERHFMEWARQNMNYILQKHPELKPQAGPGIFPGPGIGS
jgi:hypothetical protein